MLDLTQYIIVRLEDDNSVEDAFLLRMARLDCYLLPRHQIDYTTLKRETNKTGSFHNFIAWLVSSQIAEHVVPEEYYAFE